MCISCLTEICCQTFRESEKGDTRKNSLTQKEPWQEGRSHTNIGGRRKSYYSWCYAKEYFFFVNFFYK